MQKQSIIIILLLIYSGWVTAQGPKPLGSWTTHLPYNKGIQVTRNGEIMFCVVENGLFTYDLSDGNINTLTRSDGLSDVAISTINVDEESDNLILGYENGNIDIIQNRTITNIDDLKKSEVNFSKAIIDIERNEEFWFFITEFGVLVYDFNGQFVKEIWRNLGAEGNHLTINKSTILEDTLYLATREGVIAGSLDSRTNLLDFRNWKRYGIEEGIPADNIPLLESFNDILYAVQQDSIVLRNNSGIFDNTGWIFPSKIVSLNATENYLTITLEDRIAISDRDEMITFLQHDLIREPKDSRTYSDGTWLADNLNGLVRIDGNNIEAISPNGPFFSDVGSVHGFDEYLIALPPAFNSIYQPLRNKDGFSVYHNSQWKNYNNSEAINTIPVPEITDLTDVTILEYIDEAYFASFGYGLISWDLQDDFRILDDGPLFNSDPPGPNVLLTAIDEDLNNTVWMTNYNSPIPLHSLSAEEEWNEFTFPVNGSRYLTDILVLDNGDKWMSVNVAFGGGIIVFNEEDSLFRYLSTSEGNGGLPDNDITDMKMDRKGQVWLTTSRGVAYFPFPFDVLSVAEIDAILPIYNQNFLFRNERVNTIAVDGGNRKWMGTQKGAWLFDEDGIFLIENFNMGNSPLLSENILDIAINDLTGEVIFATEKGINSFRGFATGPRENFNEVKIFPNPVYPDFNGYLGIEGLPENAIIKITDVSGKLVYQTISNGGLAIWNLQDNFGKRPDTGIYLVFYSTQDGEEALVGKLSIIN